MVGNSLKHFRDEYLDDILRCPEDYDKEELQELLMLVPDSMKYRDGYKAHAKVFFSDISKVQQLPETFTYRFQFDGKVWKYSEEHNGDKELKKEKLFIKEEFNKK